MIPVEFKPITVWPDGWLTRSWDQRQPSPFSAPHRRTLTALQVELRALNTRACSISVDVGERGIRNDGQLRADARADHPGVILTIDSRAHGALVYATDRFRTWHDNLRAIVLGLEALRRVERYGISERGQQYAGFKELGSGMAMSGPSMTVERAAEFLILHGEVDDCDEPCAVAALIDDSPLQAEIVAGYRRAARRLHPEPDAEAAAVAPAAAIWPVPEGTLMPPALVDALAALAVAASELGPAHLEFDDRHPVKAAPEHDLWVHDLAVIVDHLDRVIEQCQKVQAEAAEQLARSVPFGTPRVAFSGLRPLTPRWGGTRSGWRNDLLAPKLKALIQYDPGTGEKRDADEVFDTFESVFSVLGGNAKMGGMRKLGLDPDDFCFKEPAPPTVQVTR